ncbi:gamma-glutamylcyclotransferase [Aquisalimonas sp.]|uniref:gamma-glutamylcyclotransferase family protein n=1 Tax=unclassified Aquisalimonas TaxID=2644645 RepID=UPI0025BB8D5A|nr:gamma-glutamylcyclotransferase family protein [Aquisalimonas sp.]
MSRLLGEQIFVYGTLRRGGSNHRLLQDARLLGEHLTDPVFAMLDIGPYPGVVPGGQTAVRGEVYVVTPARFRELDALEDYPRTYTRRPLTTPWGDAWIYLYRPRGQRLPQVSSGDWFRSSRP